MTPEVSSRLARNNQDMTRDKTMHDKMIHAMAYDLIISDIRWYNIICHKLSEFKIRYKSDNIKTLAKSIASPVFGGSVFLPVAKKGHKRSKKNPLEEEIVKLNTEVMQYGGYYYLPDIKDSEFSNEFLDVYLLTPHIKNQ